MDQLLQSLASRGRWCYLGEEWSFWRREPATVWACNSPLTKAELNDIKEVMPDALVMDYDETILQGKDSAAIGRWPLVSILMDRRRHSRRSP